VQLSQPLCKGSQPAFADDGEVCLKTLGLASNVAWFWSWQSGDRSVNGQSGTRKTSIPSDDPNFERRQGA